ncbi:IS110 family transposase [Metabacillus sediminilitoris]|uniref:IS110 family transposase n=1 Tax=Metabacillus sediminilitoris TaxID=2567941 RepID=A0A4S4BMJ9_9BACI|nr:IS110 family transposase [Metabacillus sediminilitoris]QGQ44847.1 IS110 family transposase [Metabacillus sediminilitoris]QGQ44848.1 IS110 family transposase [Metabacillus sediminilitoris]QGQ45540.1 IS110 family transposase [Metabacillus sediminilitoris]QGQ45907.1 IS110 family transposase [Metabacillus sediminilitoris]QGQ45929.1 IS110 family transposase [Metabacillus sediminilitoris]
MDVIIERACGMDVHKDSITACILTPEGKEIQTFSTKTVFLLKLLDWIKEHNCSHVAMESTSVYWKPIVNLLESEGIEFLVVNAQHIKAVPGRKTDVNDAEWIAKLLRHGLIKASYIPNRDQRELRELVRYRRSIIQERARQQNRIQKVLEGANIKLGSVVSQIKGVSAMEMLRAIADGEDDPVKLASFARRTLKKKKEELELALRGYISPHQRMMLKTIITHIDFLTDQIEKLDNEIAERMSSYQDDVERLDSIPGVATRMAEQILAEIGTDVKNQFPSAAHMCSWAGLVPGQNESAGKRKSSKTKKGNKYLKSALQEAAHSVRGSKNYLGALYRRTAARKGTKRAAIVVSHAILRICYYLLTRKEMYVDLGEDYFDKQRAQSIVRHSLRRLESLGYTVSLTETEAS